jgi:hypothetical protein
MKKYLLFVCVAACFTQSSVYAAGGVAPCLATCFLGDSRIGLYMNDGKPIEGMDWLVFGSTIAGSLISSFVLPPVYTSKDSAVKVSYSLPLGSIISGIDAFGKSRSMKGFCAGFLWGRRVGAEINTTKIRTKEILKCIPIVNLYPCIAIPLEAYNGKTMSQVIEEENLTR